MTKTILYLLFLSVFPLCSYAQQTAPKCHPEKSHEFDFWVGHWQVTSNGKVAGYNRIEPIMDGCMIQENWEGTQGNKGTSLNFYNPKEQRWEQFWVWRYGVPMHLKGHFRDGKMVLQGEHEGQNGKEVHRVTWTPNADGTVRQHWQKSTPNQTTWQTLFDGLYTKVESK